MVSAPSPFFPRKLGKTGATPGKPWGARAPPPPFSEGFDVLSSILGGFFPFFGSSSFDSDGFDGFFVPEFVPEAGFVFDGDDKKLWITSPATLLRDLATSTRTKSSLRIFDQPGIAISLASDPKSASVNALSSFDVAIVRYSLKANDGCLGILRHFLPPQYYLHDSNKFFDECNPPESAD